MIISEKYKYIFVGLPFSASSAISKELVENYDGKPVSWKHSNITSVTNELLEDTSKYFVFAVYRDPVEIAFAHYNKLLTNAYDTFTNPKYFRENGGWISKRARRIYSKVNKGNLDFDSYLRLNYSIPYDSVFSLNKPFLNKILDFSNLNDSFLEALREIGVEPKRELPIFNKTEKTGKLHMDKSTFKTVFSPFLYFNNISCDVKPSLYKSILYRFMQPVRVWKWKRIDRRMKRRTINDYEYLAK